jgi:uncharacterized pyridoxal phosphate-containing UPF0001 family protein
VTLNARIASVLATRSPKSKHCQLVAVSKTKPIEDLVSAYEGGQRNFGENYVDEFVEKVLKLPEDVNWHFIGHIQSNKVKKLLSVATLAERTKPLSLLIETVDTQKLAEKLNKEWEKTQSNEAL